MRHRTEVFLGGAAVVLLAAALVGFIGSAVAARFDTRHWNVPSVRTVEDRLVWVEPVSGTIIDVREGDWTATKPPPR